MAFLSIHSHRIDVLVDLLVEQDLSSIILVPNSQIRQWLLLEIAKRKSIVMGLKIVLVEELFPLTMSRLDHFAFIFQALRRSDDIEIKEYIDGSVKRELELAEELHNYFISYDLYKAEVQGWQKKIYDQLPVQTYLEISDPIICFGIDYLPPVYWERLSKCQSVTLFLFSPCVDFWADIYSDRERRRLIRYFEKKKTSILGRKALDNYLRESPKNLANWGKLGKLTQQMLDVYDVEIEECYPSFEPNSLLKKIQYDLLTFQESKNLKADDSIKILQTGSSKIHEIEKIFEEIVHLNLPYHDIAILAPDITPYVPLIQYVFGEKIPYRISGFDISAKSFFLQGLLSLFQLAVGRWDVKDVLSLFENPSFQKAEGLDFQTIELFKSWIESSSIKWGVDSKHRNDVLSSILGKRDFRDEGSWEYGIDFLLDSLIYLKPIDIDADLFELFLSIILRLKKMRISHDMTLNGWGEWFGQTVFQFLKFEAEDPSCIAFRSLLSDLLGSSSQDLFPASFIEKFLSKPVIGQIHSSHLHAVRIGSIEDGAMIPSKAIFLIGMDEDHFPRKTTFSSMDFLKGKIPQKADFDRYEFLRAIFSAEEFLRISYGHLSQEEAKPVGPSLVVEELMSKTELTPILCRFPSLKFVEKKLVWPRLLKPVSLPIGKVTLSFSDLRSLARHPWKFYLQKNKGIFLDIEIEKTFSMQKGLLLRGTLEENVRSVELPPGRFKEAIKMEVEGTSLEWQKKLSSWEIEPLKFVFQANCVEPYFNGDRYILPPIELHWENLDVSLVGEVPLASLSGLICSNEDSIGGLLKVWPEALAVGSKVWFLKSGRLKEIENREESLKKFIEYYFHALEFPSPLIIDWADALLRKGGEEFERKMEKGTTFEDVTVDWVQSRTCGINPVEMYDDWKGLLKNTFSELISLYPTRGHAKI